MAAPASDPLPVLVTSHAVRRARLRFKLRGSFTQVIDTMEREVRDALDHGRRSRSKPAWTCHEGVAPQEEPQVDGMRWVWTPCRTRTYVVRRQQGAWRVLTCLETRVEVLAGRAA